LFDGSCSAYDEVADDFDAHFGEDIDFFLDDGFWEPKFGDSINHHAAGFMESLKYSDIVASPSGIGSGDDAAGA
jgi:hypothetical protein